MRGNKLRIVPVAAICVLAAILSIMLYIRPHEIKYSEYTDYINKYEYSCGSIALSILLELEGSDVPPERLSGFLPKRPWHSLGELQQAAADCGYSLVGVHLTQADWPFDRPVLIHVETGDKGHFIVVRSVGHSGSLVQVIDPLGEVEVRDSRIMFASTSWSGMALIPTRRSDFLRATWLRVALTASTCLALIAVMVYFKRVSSKAVKA